MEFMDKISTVSDAASELYEIFKEAIIAPLPSGFGFPSDLALYTYYPGNLRISRKEIAAVSSLLDAKTIHPENTRIRKSMTGQNFAYGVLKGSVEVDTQPRQLQMLESGMIRIIQADHLEELSCIFKCLEQARKYTATPQQEKFISEYQKSFRTGDIEAYKESQRIWVKYVQPSLEKVFRFVEPYRDPFGVRAEFEG